MKDKLEKNKSMKKLRPRKAKFRKKTRQRTTAQLPVPRRFRRCSESKNVFKKNRLVSKVELAKKYVPNNLRYMITSPYSPFNINDIRDDLDSKSDNGIVYIPDNFSIIDNPAPSFKALRQIISALLFEPVERVFFDYIGCSRIDIGTQAIMDVIIIEYDRFIKKCLKINRNDALRVLPKGIGGRNINKDELKKIIFTIGSPTILGVKEANFDGVIKNKMCSHCMNTVNERKRLTEQKEIDTTIMIDYVVDCLKKMNKKLTPKKLNDLSTVVGEILINAEEHSTLHHRFSVGYFYEVNEDGKHYGMLNLVILNFGATIYEKFKMDGSCPIEIVNKMKSLSECYTKRNFFLKKCFEEETLWTLYALQQGVTSIAGKKRGNGTIQFIRSFFNIKGDQRADNVSRMIICSGNTQILFDGTYGITEKIDDKGKYNMMTFNHSGNIEEMPDKKYVKYTDTYFPGTIISANILLNDDDVKEIN